MDAKLPRAVSSAVLRVFPFRRGNNDPREAISHPPKWRDNVRRCYAPLISVKGPSRDRTRNFLIKTGTRDPT